MRKSYKKTYRKMRRVQREVESGKRGFSKIALIFILCGAASAIIIVSVAAFLLTKDKKVKNEIKTDTTVSMSTGADIPYVEMLFEDGNVYNRLTGYQSDTFSKEDKGYSLTILPSDLNQKLLISEKRDEVKGISYQVRDLNTGDLIEETEVEEIIETGGLTEAVLNIKNLVNVRQEYNLQIRLERHNSPSLIYNTRIESLEEPDAVREAVIFADEFIKRSLTDADTEYIESLIDTQASTESFNYAKTDYTSPASLIMWSGLSPQKEERAIPSLLSIREGEAKISSSYPISVQGQNGRRERIVVNDLFTISLLSEDERDQESLLLDFDRKAFETISGDNFKIKENKVPFGFQADESMKRMSSENGQYVCFVNGGSLWQIYSGTGVAATGFTRIFSFEGETGGEETEARDMTPVITFDGKGDIKDCDGGFGINVISVKDSGDVTFSVYGTFPEGVHAGESGIAVYEFSFSDQELAEVLFVKTSKDMETMRDFAAESYLNAYGEMYVTVDGVDTRINVKDYSRETVTGKSADGRILYSDDASVMAYSSKNTSVPGLSDRIEFFDRDEGALAGIDASKGEDLCLIGFIGDDPVYGVAEEGAFESTVGGVRSFYKKIVIADKTGAEKMTYDRENEYYTDVILKGGSLEFVTAKKEGEGFITGENAGVVANNAVEEDAFVLFFESSDERRKEMYGSFARGANDGDNVRYITEYKYNKGNTVEL